VGTKLSIILEFINIFGTKLLSIKPKPLFADMKMISYLCKWHEAVL